MHNLPDSPSKRPWKSAPPGPLVGSVPKTLKRKTPSPKKKKIPPSAPAKEEAAPVSKRRSGRFRKAAPTPFSLAEVDPFVNNPKIPAKETFFANNANSNSNAFAGVLNNKEGKLDKPSPSKKRRR